MKRAHTCQNKCEPNHNFGGGRFKASPVILSYKVQVHEMQVASAVRPSLSVTDNVLLSIQYENSTVFSASVSHSGGTKSRTSPVAISTMRIRQVGDGRFGGVQAKAALVPSGLKNCCEAMTYPFH